MLFIVYGIIGGIGVGITYGVPVAVSARWFPDRRGTAVGLTLLGFGFSAFLTANIAGFLIAGTGIMNTFRIFGVAFIILIVFLALPLRFPAAGWKPTGWTPPFSNQVKRSANVIDQRWSGQPHFTAYGCAISSGVWLG
jgi:OFA family oxalate/formate antiporter-like MFS transporter